MWKICVSYASLELQYDCWQIHENDPTWCVYVVLCLKGLLKSTAVSANTGFVSRFTPVSAC